MPTMSYDEIIMSGNMNLSVEGPQKKYEYLWEILSIQKDNIVIKINFE